jgi:Thaumatin family/Ricin-type beta-trefoil lectin domain
MSHIRMLVVSSWLLSGCQGVVDSPEHLQASSIAGTINLGTLASPGKCLDVSGARSADGTNIQSWTCNGTGAQAFRVEWLDGAGGIVRLVNVPTNKCVDVAGAGTADGTNVQLWTCNGTGAQSFYVEDAGGGNNRFVNTHALKCLDVAGAGTADGTNVQLWTCNRTNAQTWRPANINGGQGGGSGSGGSGSGGAGGAGSGNFSFTNRCAQTVWVGALNNPGFPLPEGGGFALAPGQTHAFQLPDNWGGRFWGRTGCSFNGAGQGTCATGDCGARLACGGAGGVPPATLIEFTNVAQGTDFYDVSLVDGYNLPARVVPRAGTFTRSDPNNPYDCGSPGCVSDLNATCPAELQEVVGGRVVACMSACERFNTDQYCCRGAYGSPATCPPTSYSQIFKQACPSAYSYAYDDRSSTFTCQGSAYDITFCP